VAGGGRLARERERERERERIREKKKKNWENRKNRKF